MRELNKSICIEIWFKVSIKFIQLSDFQYHKLNKNILDEILKQILFVIWTLTNSKLKNKKKVVDI